jgi:hypothetical protein
MNEQPIRIVVSTTTTAFKKGPDGSLHPIQKPTIFQKGKRLPPPEGMPEDPLRIVDIMEFEANEETGEDGFFMIFSVAEDGTPAQQHDVGFVTRIPADLVIRKDAHVSATEMLMTLKEMQAQQLAEDEEPPTQVPVQSGPQVQRQVHAPTAVQAPPPRQPAAPNPQQFVQVAVPPQVAAALPPEIAAMAPPPEPQESGLLDSVETPHAQEQTNASDDGQ